MKKALRAATGRGQGRGVRRGAGRPARQPTFGRVRGAWLPVALASPTRPEEGTSRTRRCVGRGLRGRRAIHQVSRGVPQRRFALRAKFPFMLCYWVDVCVSADPAKLSWLRRLPTDVPVEPRSPARRGLPPAVPPWSAGSRRCGATGPPASASPLASCRSSRCLVSVCVRLWGSPPLFLIFALRLGGSMGAGRSHDLWPTGCGKARVSCGPAALQDLACPGRAAAWARAARPPRLRPHLHVAVCRLRAPGTGEGGHLGIVGAEPPDGPSVAAGTVSVCALPSRHVSPRSTLNRAGTGQLGLRLCSTLTEALEAYLGASNC